MKDILRPMLELFVALPGLLLAYFPVKSYLKQSPRNLAAWLLPLMAGLGVGGGLVCYRLRISTVFVLAGITLLAIVLYTRTLRISLWKSGTIALSICAVFACLNSLSRAVSAAIVLHMQLPPDGPWFCFAACVFYNAVCWVFVLAASYPSTHAVRAMVEDDNFAQTWYVFWVLPLVFILLNLFMIPRYQTTLQTGRVLQGYIVLSIALLVLLLWFNTIFLLMANSLNRNARLQQENQLLSMQQQRYESLKTAIEEARQARHDMRHQLNHISALAEAGELEDLKSYLAKTVSRIPNLDMCFCENRTADSVVGYYCALAKREDIPFRTKLDLPESLPIDEVDMCLILSNLLENALEASLRTAPARRQIEITAYVHAKRLLLIEVVNAFDGKVNEKNGVFLSSKRKESGIGIQAVNHIAEKKRRNKYVYPSEWRFLRQSHALWISGNTYYSQVTTKLPWKAFAFRGSLCFTSMQLVLLQSVFQLAVERFGLYMLLQGLGRIYTAQRAVEPLSLYGGVGGDTPSLFFYAVAAIRHISADPIEAHSHEI